MENTNNRKASPMEDDEDLEFLRLAALKSLKKDSPPKSSNAIVESRVIPVMGHPNLVRNVYAPGEPELIQPNLIHHPVPPYINSGFEKMDINETYLPQRLNAPVAPYSEFAAFGAPPNGIMDPTTNVQLSPRSAAFVFENKQIIKRRQGLSPSPGRISPGRWSRSPSPESWKYRRSKSRSPAYANHSPHFRNRSASRSPHRRRQHSPQPANIRRNRTRSPAARNNERNAFDNNAHRVERRSPAPNRRGNSPNNRHPPARPWRDNGVHARKSGSPRGDDTINRRRRTRSPNANANVKLDVRRRSTSRSPNRKFPRPNPQRPPRRASPSKRFNNNASNKPGHSGVRNRNYNRRSGSPVPAHSRRSHSPQNHHRRRSLTRNVAQNGGDTAHKNGEKESTSEGCEKPADDKEENGNESATKEKVEQGIEDDFLASSDSENSDNDDGIDLFASEESESENEGRFKSSSSKIERKTNVPVVSFSELGKATTAPADVLLRDLDELQADTNSTQRRGGGGGGSGSGGGRRDNDRDRNRNNRRDDRRYNRDRDRDRENRDRNRDRARVDRRERERERDSSKPRSGGSWKNSKNDDGRKKDEVNGDDAKGDRKTNLFKSTFTSVDSEHKRKTPDGGADKPGDQKTKSSGEKSRSAIVQLKRSSKSSEKSTETKSLQTSMVGSTTNEKRTSSPTDSSNANAKKPIHLRLGAMTKTFKPNKKTWRTEKVLSIIV